MAIAKMDAVPSLIVFPGKSIPVSDAKQTEDFFASSWGQYDGVDAVEKQIAVMAEAPGSIWADVTWSYGGRPRERFCYQLVEGGEGYSDRRAHAHGTQLRAPFKNEPGAELSNAVGGVREADEVAAPPQIQTRVQPPNVDTRLGTEVDDPPTGRRYVDLRRYSARMTTASIRQASPCRQGQR
jgi:hypothetical protein